MEEKGVTNYRFCPLCAGPLEKQFVGGKWRLACRDCHFVLFRNPAPAAGAIVEKNGKVLLVRRKWDPYQGCWCLPAGFIEYEEDPATCAVRELQEETGLEVELGEIFGVYSGDDDPRTRAILVVYLARQVGGALRAGDDASEVKFFAPEELPVDIAFHAHRQVLREYFGKGNGENSGSGPR